MYSFLCPAVVLYYLVGFLMPCVCSVCAYILRHVKQPRPRKESKKLDFAKEPLYTYMLLLLLLQYIKYIMTYIGPLTCWRDRNRSGCAQKDLSADIERALERQWRRTNFFLFSWSFFLWTGKCVHVTSWLHGRRSISRRRISKSEENQKMLAFCSDGWGGNVSVTFSRVWWDC
jgi:hypothetical protein